MTGLLPQEKNAIMRALQREILPLQGLKNIAGKTPQFLGLEQMSAAFPNAVFPTGMLHEFTTDRPESAAASSGFLGGLLGGLMQENGAAIWIGCRRNLFPPALKSFGVKPENIIFIDLPGEKKILWAMEEALKCPGISAVVSEVSDLSFTDSRRLQLATEQSGVTGLILRHPGRKLSTNACVARWRITPLSSENDGQMPGVGYPRWNVELLKIRNGKPGTWTVSWSPGGFRFDSSLVAAWPLSRQRKAG